MTPMDVAIPKIDDKWTPALTYAKGLSINSQSGLENGKEAILGIKAIRDEISSHLDPLISQAYTTHKALVAKKKEFCAPLDEAEGVIKHKINGYLDYLEEERRKEQARLSEIAERERQKKIDALTKKLDAALDKIESMQGKKSLLEQQLLVADPDEAMTIRTRLQAVINKLNLAETKAADHQIQMETATIPTEVIVEQKGVDVAGLSSRVEMVPTDVSNPRLLAQAVADGRVPVSVITWHMGNIKKVKNMGIEVPGVTFTRTRVTATRRSR